MSKTHPDGRKEQQKTPLSLISERWLGQSEFQLKGENPGNTNGLARYTYGHEPDFEFGVHLIWICVPSSL